MPVAPIGAPIAVSPAGAPKTPAKSSFGAQLRTAQAQTAPKPSSPATAPTAPHRAVDAMKGIAAAQKRLDAMLDAAKSGKTFSAQELIALQAEAYRYSQTIDVASKVVEHAAQSVKQAVNTQV